MDAQRALLDELMGAERDVPLTQRSNRQLHFTDPGVCKFELAGVCPNQLFTNTRSDLGPCRALYHSDHLEWPAVAAQWSAIPKRERRHRYPYERDLHLRLRELVRDMDRRVERAKERAAAESAPRTLQPQDARRLDDMERRAREALAAAEGAGEAGDVLASLEAAGAASELRAAAARSRQQLTQPERVLTVCEVCGIFISSTDNEARRQEHVTGKQYQGWRRLREALREMDEESLNGGGGGRGERDPYGHASYREERYGGGSRGRSRGGSREPEWERPRSPGGGGGWGGGGRRGRGGDGGGGVPPPAGLYGR